LKGVLSANRPVRLVDRGDFDKQAIGSEPTPQRIKTAIRPIFDPLSDV